MFTSFTTSGFLPIFRRALELLPCLLFLLEDLPELVVILVDFGTIFIIVFRLFVFDWLFIITLIIITIFMLIFFVIMFFMIRVLFRKRFEVVHAMLIQPPEGGFCMKGGFLCGFGEAFAV